MRAWSIALAAAARAGEEVPSPILLGFADHYSLLAAAHDRTSELIAQLIERRARHRGSEMVRAHLLALAQDVRSEFHLEDAAPAPDLYQHADGGEYIRLGVCAVKDDETGEWVDGVAYRAVSGPRHDLLCVTTQQRWDDRFEPVAP